MLLASVLINFHSGELSVPNPYLSIKFVQHLKLPFNKILVLVAIFSCHLPSFQICIAVAFMEALNYSIKDPHILQSEGYKKVAKKPVYTF